MFLGATQTNGDQQEMLPSQPQSVPPPPPLPPSNLAHLLSSASSPADPSYPAYRIPQATAPPPPVVEVNLTDLTGEREACSDTHTTLHTILQDITYYIERKLARYPTLSYSTITPNIIDITAIEYQKQLHEKNTGYVYFIKSLVSLEGSTNPQYMHLRVAKSENQPAVLERMIPLMKENDALGYLAPESSG